MANDDTPPTLLLVDGSAYLYRAYHALPPLSAPDGTPTGAVFGIINMLRKLLADEAHKHVAVVFDAPGPTFRDALFEQYKAHRPPMPEELRVQQQIILELVEQLGLPLLRIDGVEADDVIGTLARRALADGMRVVIATGDKDMAQLVNDRLVLVDSMRGTRLDPAGVAQKFGVPPERIIDWLALVGDSSDNVPGVAGVGPKTAVKWLGEFGSLDALIERADELKGKVGQTLRDSLEQLELSRRLVTIDCDVPLPLTPAELVARPPDHVALAERYRQLGFRSLAEAAERAAQGEGGGAEPGEADAPVRPQVATLLDEAALADWLARLAQADAFVFDLETDRLFAHDAHIVGVALAVEPGAAAYIPFYHGDPDGPRCLEAAVVLERLRPLLEDAEKAKIAQNLKFDLSVLAANGITLRGGRYDTMLESYVLDSVASRHDMDSLARKYLGYAPIPFEAVAGKGAKQLTFDQVPLDQAAEYAGEDAEVTLRLHQALWPQLEQAPALRTLFETVEMPLVPVLARMERHGVLIDPALLQRQSGELAERIGEVEQRAHAMAGEPFNLASPAQIQQVLFERLGLPVKAKTPKGQPSTAEPVLQELAEEGHELPALLLQHRSLSKLRSTYTDRLPQQVHPVSGRVHTSYHQAVTATGRLSSSDPNLQNIPIRTPEGRRIRQAFIAPPDWSLLAADYSQIELRIMAHLSGDPGLLAALAEERDIHTATAAEVFGVALDQVSGEQRRSAKAINFGLIYGMSAFGLARQLGIGREAAQGYIDRYFARYPGVRDYMERTREQAREQGYVETVFGRRLYLPEINSRNGQRRQYAERTAINAPMQGTAADIIKRAMISVDAWLQAGDVPARMVMQVHDELVFEVADDAIEYVRAAVVERMEGAARLAVPLRVESGVGKHWDAAH